MATGTTAFLALKGDTLVCEAYFNGRAVDLAKLGVLYLHEGAWRGEQLVAARLGARSDPGRHRPRPLATVPVLLVDAAGRPGPHRLLGPGQFIYVAPERDVVLVRFGTDHNYDHWPELLAELARRL